MTSPRSAEETKVRSPGVEDRPTGGGHARGPANPTVAVSVVDSSGTGGEHLTSPGCKCSRFVAIHLEYICMSIFTRTYVCNTLPETNMFAPENGWFGILVSFWEGLS